MKHLLFLPLAALFAHTPAALGQGSLTPPAGPPGPEMKTLDEVESRTALPATTTAAPGPFITISDSGSYYLTGNVTVTSGDGILITASDVTLDLGGFTLTSTLATVPTAGNAITLAPGISSVVIKNGHIKGTSVRTGSGGGVTFSRSGWFRGIDDDANATAGDIVVSHLSIRGCADNGIDLNGGSRISHVVSRANAGCPVSARRYR